jgi:hypothetical protein
VTPASFSTDRDERRMLAQNQSRRVAIAGNLIDEPALQSERSLELHQSEHVNLQDGFAVGGCRKW